MDPHEYTREKAAPAGSSLHYSVRGVPPAVRRALIAIHAYRLEVTAIAREVSDGGVARTKLAWWRDEVERLYAGAPRHPVARALLEGLAQFGVERGALEEIIHGAAMDLEYNAYPDFGALEVYCRRVGGVPWRLSARICGYSDPGTLAYAEALGIALALTRIIREVGEDARRGRVYLPLHDMAEYGVTSDDLVHARESEAFVRLVRAQVAQAVEHYERALSLLPKADRNAQRPSLAMAAIHCELLREIEADGCHVLTRKTSLTPLRKLWLAWRTR